MCKILIMSGIAEDAVTQANAWKFAKAMGKIMTLGNSDGLGFAALSSNGEVFGERWVENKEAFQQRTPRHPIVQSIIDAHGGVLEKPITYNRFGLVDFENDEIIKAITLHTRAATTPKNIENTHPFKHKDTTLIHNGVVDMKPLTYKTSTCDSEGILNSYVEYKVVDNIKNIQKVANKLDGWYACAVFAKHSSGAYILDVFKDNKASLHAAYIKELGCLVICTSSASIEEGAKECGFTIVSDFKINHEYIWRYDPMTGEVIDYMKFASTNNVSQMTNRYNADYWKDRHDYQRNLPTTSCATARDITSQTSRSAVTSEMEDYEYNGDGIWAKKYLA